MEHVVHNDCAITTNDMMAASMKKINPLTAIRNLSLSASAERLSCTLAGFQIGSSTSGRSPEKVAGKVIELNLTKLLAKWAIYSLENVLTATKVVAMFRGYPDPNNQEFHMAFSYICASKG